MIRYSWTSPHRGQHRYAYCEQRAYQAAIPATFLARFIMVGERLRHASSRQNGHLLWFRANPVPQPDVGVAFAPPRAHPVIEGRTIMDRISTNFSLRVLTGVVAGAVAGLTASLVMDRFQAVAARLITTTHAAGTTDPSTVVAASIVSERLGLGRIPSAYKPLAGQAVHYAFGTALGMGYGAVAAIMPSVTKGVGTGMGAAACVVFDEMLVPLARLGAGPTRAPLTSHVFSLASHLVFGVTAELVRRQVVRTLHPDELNQLSGIGRPSR